MTILLCFLALVLADHRTDFSGVYESGVGEDSTVIYRVHVSRTEAGYECSWVSAASNRLCFSGDLVWDGQWVESYPERSPIRCPDYGWFLDGGRPVQVTRNGAAWWLVRVQ